MAAQMEIYTTGGGVFLKDGFNFLAAFTSSGNFEALMFMAITMSVLFYTWKLMWGQGFKEAAQWFLLVAVIGTVMIGTRATVVIFDKTKSNLPYAIVDNVPYGIALVGHYTSTVGHYVTELYEAQLSTPDSVGYQNNGMLFGAPLLAQTTRWRTTSTTLHSTLNNYLKNCGLDGALIGHVDFDEVSRSGNLSDTLAATAPNSLAFYNEFTEATVTCADGVDDLLGEVDVYVDQLLIQKAGGMFSDLAPGVGNSAVNRVTSSLDGFMSMITTSAQSSRDQLAQGVLIQALDSAILGYISDSGNSAAMDQYRAARTEAQTSASYQSSWTQGIKWVPMMKIAFEFIYYCFFPIAVILMLTPMSFGVMKGYFSGFIWLASWEPISAMIHGLVMRRAAGYYAEAGTIISDDGTKDFVVNFSNHLAIRSVESDVSTLAGSLIWLVPFLASGLVYGANKFASMSTSMTNVPQGAAIDVGKESALGNHTMATVNANKFNTSTLMDHGRNTRIMDSGASETTNADGSVRFAKGTAASDFMTSPSFTNSMRRASSQRVEQARSQAQRASTDQRSHIEQSTGVYSEMIENSGKSDSFTDGGGNSYSTSQHQKFSESSSKIQDFAKSQNMSTDLAIQASMAAGLKGSAREAFTAGLDANGTLRGVSREAFDKTVKAAEQQNMSKELSNVESFRRESGWQASEQWGMSESQASKDMLNEGRSISESLSQANERVARASKSDEYVKSLTAQGSTGLSNVLQDYMERKGYSPQQITSTLNPSTPGQIAEGNQMVEGVLDFVGKSVGLDTGLSGLNAATSQKEYSSPLMAGQGTHYSKEKAAAFKTENTPQNPVIRRDDRANAVVQENNAGRDRHSSAIERKTNAAQKDIGNHQSHVNAETDRTVGGAVAGRALGMADPIVDSLIGKGAPANEAAGGNVRALTSEESAREVALDRLNEGVANYSPFGSLAAAQSSGQYTEQFTGGSAITSDMMVSDRDSLIRTIIGEASGEGAEGWAAVAHVVKNRVEDPRWANNIQGVVFQDKAFSAWNSGAGGNHLVNKYGPGDARYEQVGAVVDKVFAGQIADATQGATHYYSPAGMDKLVADGDQKNVLPTWLQNEQNSRPEADVRLGGHIFTGKKKG